MSLGIGPLGGAPLGGGTTYAVATGVVSARYWRFVFSENNQSSNTAAAEIELRNTAGADLTGSGTASDNGNIGSQYTAASLFDNNNTTMWNAGRTDDNYIQYDFGSPQEIGSYTVRARNDSFLSDSPRAWALFCSNDGVTWILVHAISEQTAWASSEQRVYWLDVGNSMPQYWRLDVTASINTLAVAVAEMKMMESIGGANVAIPTNARTKASNGTMPNDPPRNAINGNPSNQWIQPGSSGWMQVEFGKGRDVREYSITARNDGYHGDSPKDWTLKYSFDGVTWVVADTVVGQPAWSSGETRTFTVDTPATPGGGGGGAASSHRKPHPWQRGSVRGNSYKF